MSSESRRLEILSAREITDLYGLPSFTDEERRLYFDLSPAEQTAVTLCIRVRQRSTWFFNSDISRQNASSLSTIQRRSVTISVTS